jgi:amidase
MSKIPPNIQPPTPEEIRQTAAKHYIDLSEDEVEDFALAIEDTLNGYERLDELSAPRPNIQYTDRDFGYKPDRDEDPLNAFVTKCRVEGNESGPLSDYEIGLKDSIAVAGVEMTVGSKLFDGYVPSTDATIVTRLLDAGATITGKLNMEDMAFSGSGELSATGPVLNPRNPEYIAGGSSSGSIAAVVNDDVDVSIGSDQGGSVRIPASWSGGVGHKPTHGLVPYTGTIGLGHTIDHLGPMATNVDDCALILDVIAGKDPLDPRQRTVQTGEYADAVSDATTDLTVGVVDEGFGHEQSEEAVDTVVHEALSNFEDAGANLVDVSIPLHRDGLAIWNGIVMEETTALIRDEGIGRYGRGFYDPQLADTFGKARRAHADDFMTTVKLTLILGQYMSDEYRSHYYAKAQNLARELGSRYDEALSDVDVLAMPTTPQTAHKQQDNLTRLEVIDRALNMLSNTAPSDATGHPAISVPAGEANGLPVGLMFVGEQFGDETVLQVGQAYEQSVGWDLT